jgi:hypothetical protein
MAWRPVRFSGRRSVVRRAAVWTVVGLLVAISPGFIQAAAQTASVGPTTRDYVFPTGSGALFFHVKPERTADFESVLATLSDVLSRSADPTRRQQAENWRIFKSTETPKDSAIYIFLFDPAVTGADYDPIKVLGEAVPVELQALYDRLRDDVLRVERMGLSKLR